MALIESKEVQLQTIMPEFTLSDSFGKVVTSKEIIGEKGLLIAFTCNHCPYAVAIWPRLIQLAAQAKSLGVTTVAINPNIHPDYPEDGLEFMQVNVQNWGLDFPYLVDNTQSVAKDYQALCTPDLYLLNQDMQLVYHGRLDDNWRDEKSVKIHDLADAITALSQGQTIQENQIPSMGCSIKWI